MSGQVIPMRRSRRKRIAIELLQYKPPQWLMACECGQSSRHPSRDGARAARRRHQADHDRAEAMHPAGKGRPNGGGTA